jgi:hypothetical protein
MDPPEDPDAQATRDLLVELTRQVNANPRRATVAGPSAAVQQQSKKGRSDPPTNQRRSERLQRILPKGDDLPALLPPSPESLKAEPEGESSSSRAVSPLTTPPSSEKAATPPVEASTKHTVTPKVVKKRQPRKKVSSLS